MALDIQFASARLRLVTMDAQDLDRFHSVMSDAVAMRTFDECRTLTLYESAEHLQRWTDHHREHGYSPGLIEHSESEEVVGFGGIANYPGYPDTSPELVYVLKAPWWGQGLGSEFAASAVAYAFDTLSVPKLFATVLPHNEASIRILERIGMTREAYLEKAGRHLYAISSKSD